MADKWKVRWEEVNDSVARPIDYIWASTDFTNEDAARAGFKDAKGRATSLGYRSVQLWDADGALLDEWPT